MQQLEISWQVVESSNVQSVAYDEPSMTLAVEYLRGGLYTYEGVGEQVYASLINSASVGRYLNDAVKGSYPYMKHNSKSDLLEHIQARRLFGWAATRQT